MQFRNVLAAIVVLGSGAAAAPAPGVIHVPADHPTIQAAILAATDGDTVLVAPGTYVENIDFLGKSLTVRGWAGSAVTAIAGNPAGSVVTLASGEGPGTLLEGFTITGGTGTPTGPTAPSLGGGVYVAGASPTLRACLVLGNTTRTAAPASWIEGHGGGIYAAAGSVLTLVDCGVSSNQASFGGGIHLDASSAILSNCSLSANRAESELGTGQGGGGIHAANGSDVDLDGCTISGNVVIRGDGGGLYTDSSTATLSSCSVVFNDGGGASVIGSAGYGWGGGIYSTPDSSVDLTGSDVSDNWGDYGGGGLCGTANLTDCTVSRNRGQFGGGAYAVDMTFQDCVISDNRGSLSGTFDFGGGLYVAGNGVCTGSTIRGNSIFGPGGGAYGGFYRDCVLDDNRGFGDFFGRAGGGVFQASLEDCVISDNEVFSGGGPGSGSGGGADHCYLERCLLYGNVASESGGAASNSTLVQCTVVGNTCAASGGAVHSDVAAVTVVDSILWGNAPDEIAAGGVAVSYSDVDGSWPGAGNLDLDPMFWNPVGADFHLLPGSPCIDAGNPASPLDPDGTIADMGALPFDPSYVPATVNYCSAGTSASGCRATLSAVGTASATAASGFVLAASNVEGNKEGLYFFGTNGRKATPWGNGTSTMCLVAPVTRAGLLAASGTNGSCDGAFSQDLNTLWCPTCPNPAKNPGAGAVVQVQLWYRDPQNTSNRTTSFSDALELGVGP